MSIQIIDKYQNFLESRLNWIEILAKTKKFKLKNLLILKIYFLPKMLAKKKKIGLYFSL